VVLSEPRAVGSYHPFLYPFNSFKEETYGRMMRVSNYVFTLCSICIESTKNSAITAMNDVKLSQQYHCKKDIVELLCNDQRQSSKKSGGREGEYA
jgi:superfamily II helicase